jgi:methionyl-tRNA formyltransferase
LIKAWAQEAGVAQEEVPELGLDRYQLPSPFRTPAPNDLLITASFGHLLPPSLLDAFPASQRLNLHPSLLPELRGAAPIQWAIAWQMKRTGVSIQTLGDKFDSGNILAQKEVAIPPLVKYEALEEILAKHGSQLLLKVLRDLPEFAAKAWPQSEAPANIGTSLARKLKPSWSDVRWDKQTANEIEARHRAFGYLVRPLLLAHALHDTLR